MTFWSKVGGFFKAIGRGFQAGFRFAVERGLTDEVLRLALGWARVAADQFADNAQRREFVVRMLIARGVPEFVARLAVELAVSTLKKELASGEAKVTEKIAKRQD